MGKLSYSSLAAACVNAGRGLMDQGFFSRERPGGFAVSFENGDPDLFGYMVPFALRNPQVMTFKGLSAFVPFSAAMLPNAETLFVLDAADVLAMGFQSFGFIPPPYRPFVLASGVRPLPEEITPFFFAEPPCSERRAPNREEAALLLTVLIALSTAHERGELVLLPIGQGKGEFSDLHVEGPPDRLTVTIQTATFGSGLDLPGGRWS